MIIAKSEKTVTETFGLIKLDMYFQGHPIMLKVSPNLPSEWAERIRVRSNAAITEFFHMGADILSITGGM